MPKKSPVASARRTLEIEIKGLRALNKSLDARFAESVEMIAAAQGRVIVSGMGKSGHIARKIAATLASTGTPALFVHPAEAAHGDLGMISHDDIILALSWSGETEELHNLITYSRRFHIPLIALTANPKSALAKTADKLLPMPASEEACPIGLAPTTSTTLQLAMGDALAVALLERNGFTPERFKDFHPGGALGARLKTLRDIMHTGDALPLCAQNAPMSDVLVAMSQKGFGCAGITDSAGRLVGIVTDGDLRRHMEKNLLAQKAKDVMTRKPKTAPPDRIAAAALEMMNAARITALFIVETKKPAKIVPVGIVHLHDFLRLKSL